MTHNSTDCFNSQWLIDNENSCYLQPYCAGWIPVSCVNTFTYMDPVLFQTSIFTHKYFYFYIYSIYTLCWYKLLSCTFIIISIFPQQDYSLTYSRLSHTWICLFLLLTGLSVSYVVWCGIANSDITCFSHFTHTLLIKFNIPKSENRSVWNWNCMHL